MTERQLQRLADRHLLFAMLWTGILVSLILTA